MNETPAPQPVPAKSPKWPLFLAGGIVGLFVLMLVANMVIGRLLSGAQLSGIDDIGGGSAGWSPNAASFNDLGGSLFDANKQASPDYGEDIGTTSEPPIDDGVAPTDQKDRMIIKTATINSEVEDLDEAGKVAKQITEKFGGYVIGYTKYDDSVYSAESVAVTVRVPVDNFDKLVEEFEGIGKVTYQTSNGDDVTDQYVDLQSKLKNLEASEQQYKEIMKLATKVSEVLEVQRELTTIRSEIEVLKGQMQYYEKSAELSTVSITFSLKTRSQEVIDDTWDPNGTIRNALRALTDSFQAVADAVIYIVILSPVVLVPIIIVWLVVKVIKRARLKAK